MIASQDAEAAGVDWNRFVETEFGGEVGDDARTQDAGMAGAPRLFRTQILLHSAIRVIDAAVQRKL